MKRIFLAIWWVFLTPYSLFGMPTAEVELPRPLGYVSDYANILSPEWKSQIRSVCKDLETRTGVEMIVVTLSTVAPLANAQDYAAKLYEGWRIGTAQQERGILLLTSMRERQAVVVLGRALLAVVGPEKLDHISEQHLVPMFHSTSYGEQLYRSSVLLATAAGRTPLASDKDNKSKSVGFWMNLGVVILMLYTVWRFTRPERRHPFQRWRRGEYWGTGQGGFGGNFGGFGGGMSGQSLG
jgi:uncharacterized protein